MIRSAATHRCRPTAPLRMKLAQRQGYVEAYHEHEQALARARVAVLSRAGFQTMIEEAADGFIVLARATQPSSLARAA